MRSILSGAIFALALTFAACSPAQDKAGESPAPETVSAPAEPADVTEAPAPSASMVALNITDAAGAQMSGDPARGARIFAQCASCHSVEEGMNRVGPSLHGIVGRAAGTVMGFRYSDANRTSGVTWSEQELFSYLENPRARIPGTTMAFAGIRNAQQRADLIAYLKQPASD